jgi:hypothetical protein
VPVVVGEDGTLGVGAQNCIFVLDSMLRVLDKRCGEKAVVDASHSNGVFAFVSMDEHVHLFRSGKYWRSVKVGDELTNAVAVLPDGFIACYKKCARFTFDGEKLWEISVGRVGNEVAVRGEHAYVGLLDGRFPPPVTTELLILDLKSGRKLGRVEHEGNTYSVASCGDYLAVGTLWHLYLHDISDPARPRVLWKAEGFSGVASIAFSPGCAGLAVADHSNKKLKLFTAGGRLFGERKYRDVTWQVSWGAHMLAVETEAKIYIYRFTSP